MGLFDRIMGIFGSGGSKLPKVDVNKRFNLLGRTGQGSMSKVFQAYDKTLGRNVCLKVLDKVKTQRFEDRFKQQNLVKPSEGEICMGLRHRNIVQTFEHGLTTDGEPYLILEWIDGLGMNYLIETRSANLNGKRIDYLIQLADALEYLHNERLMHRDLCPRNIMVTNDGVVKLIDFGLTIPNTKEFCRPGNRTGTADYLAPEVIKRMTTDLRVDIFALGVTAYEIFTGQLPWERSASSEETLRRHLNTPPRSPKDMREDLDDDLCEILLKAIARDPRERFASAAAFRDAIKSLDRQDY
ncbi:serine/threonine protein kinase [Tuwongella immobilis]|uniref:Protein kinase domain-containing protein n=1 Tax=Tuwongella immobilis TaxID=692036 RepID=A0A6C2YLA9_9BACT|nr:serine/threonine-protein kinase [Tuwongella immobilis]VIP02019.1 serine threonine protein kinase : Serine/threonine-protein kinase OS=Planctomyces maris DSM 8797 GN=PM8797T_31735 PE=4 SV=1: Pkinase [Tuwongella immobilis]VTS00144.1 serine threonine protein kinase : Serine/threonine-protein kinase OS=Planctomyces maris DSM 8797 GN=PM8797T_31735 PE=4 SV=1: Pkinase [Tuwongella immobilis]